jgi:hypothetical protein
MADFMVELHDADHVVIEHFVGASLLSVMFRIARLMANEPALIECSDVMIRRVSGDVRPSP